MKTIGIFGMGAIGSVLAKYLIQNRHNECLFFNRTKHKSVRIEYGKELSEISLNLSDESSERLDWLFICLKEYHILDAKKDLKKLIDKGAKVAIFQNGINLAESYRNLIPEEQILETVIDCPVDKICKAEFRQIRQPEITVPKNKLASEFINLFDSDEVRIRQALDFKRVQWVKLIESSAIGAIQSIAGQPCSVFQEVRYLDDYKLLVREGIEVARSESINLDEDIEAQLLIKLKNYPDSKGSSMLADKLNGNTLELEAKIGAIVRVAQKNKIEVPNSDRYYKALLSYNREIII